MSTAVVVGSGPNGLAGAIRLAQEGLDVTVLEAHDRPGGGTRTSELTLPGLLHDDCAAFHPTGVASPYFASLGLERHGLRWLWPEIDLAHPLDDGRAGIATRDMNATVATLGRDGARWRRIFDPIVRNFDDLIGEVFQPVAHVPRHPLTLSRFGVKALLPATWTARRFSDDPAKALFMGVAAHAFGRLDTPLSGSVGLMLTGSAHAVGWPVAEGGTEAITRALIAELQEHGGKVRTGVRVTSLDQLRELTGAAPDVVLLDTAPAGVLDIVGDRLPRRVHRALSRYTYGPAAFKVDFAIEGDIPWINEDCRRAGTLHLGGTAEQIRAIEAGTVRGEMAEQPFVLLGQQYLIDPSRSSGGANPVYAYAHVPHGWTGDATEAITGQIERFAPGFRDLILATSTRSAPEMEVYNANYVGGDISAGANTALQIAFRPRPALNPYALGVDGVYLCSSATPPGGGVHGMGGFNAAETALRRLR
ncbi:MULTISPECIES: phytoene desaturase family protein [unclassified Nocardioides]|uniref:phytoene desaturase family protein n=1 Tax=unclassified Nocardioides TaxID=2615069 RepID=UPI0006FCB01B|nr:MULTISPECIES: NAD(P)/FAD-dependent oxidoreductase [unclassified Nocardioides]KRA31206.1 FAD-dependent oxidoreductase [Nocardioides sp. Root614]KRA87826.1 FAD-dependent oxidoreductase [Nocardioides sp. Root682]